MQLSSYYNIKTALHKDQEESTMRLSDVEKKARQLGVPETWKLSKKELIQEIQRLEGNNVCFSSGIRNCPQKACLWRPSCQ